MAGKPPEHKLTEEELVRLDDMASVQCKDYTIAEVLGIDVTTLKKHYSKRLIQKRAIGRVSIHKAQANMINQPVMAIWLGKQHLSQADKVEGDITHKILNVAGLEQLEE